MKFGKSNLWFAILVLAIVPACQDDGKKQKKEREEKQKTQKAEQLKVDQFVSRLYRVKKLDGVEMRKKLKNLTANQVTTMVEMWKELKDKAWKLEKQPELIKNDKYNRRMSHLLGEVTRRLDNLGIVSTSQRTVAMVEIFRRQDRDFLTEKWIPHLEKELVREVEGEAKKILRQVMKAQKKYKAKHKKFAADVATLVKDEFLSSDPTSEKGEYQYTMKLKDGGKGVAVIAEPWDKNVGWKGFYIDDTGFLRYSNDGTTPTGKSPKVQ